MMFSDLIDQFILWEKIRNNAVKSESRSLRLEPRQIQSVSCVPGDEGGFVATFKKKLFGPPEIVINIITHDNDDPVKNRIIKEVPSPWWATDRQKLYWVTDRQNRLRCVRVTLSEYHDYDLMISTQTYIRVRQKNGEDILIFPVNRTEYNTFVDKINEMITTDKPVWLRLA